VGHNVTQQLARSFARIHWQNLANFGIVALEFADRDDYDRVEVDDELVIEDIRGQLPAGNDITVHNATRDEGYRCTHRLSPRQVETVLAGGVIPQLAKHG
jgi:aconitate hydratase